MAGWEGGRSRENYTIILWMHLHNFNFLICQIFLSLSYFLVALLGLNLKDFKKSALRTPNFGSGTTEELQNLKRIGSSHEEP